MESSPGESLSLPPSQREAQTGPCGRVRLAGAIGTPVVPGLGTGLGLSPEELEVRKQGRGCFPGAFRS